MGGNHRVNFQKLGHAKSLGTGGYLHAKSLGKGGEFLSYVWLLLFYMGMETVAEKTQRSELQEETDEGGPVVDPR